MRDKERRYEEIALALGMLHEAPAPISNVLATKIYELEEESAELEKEIENDTK